MSDAPARNTRAATAASATSGTTDQSPWAHDIQIAVGALRDDVNIRFGSVERRLEDTSAQLAEMRTESAIQHQSLVDLIKGTSPAAAPPATAPETPASPTVVVPTPTPLGRVTAIPQALSMTAAGSPTPVTTSAGPAPWSQGPIFKAHIVDNSPPRTSPPGLGIQFVDDTSPTSSIQVDQSGLVTVAPAGVPKGYTIKTSDIGTFDGTPEDLELFLARVEAIHASEQDLNWRQAVLRAMPLLMRGYAASWHQTLEPTKRASLISLGAWFRELRAAFSPDPTYMRQLARARSWEPDHEDVVGYAFDKAALLKAAFTGVPDSELIYDVVDRLPVEIRKLLRTPHSPGATLVDLRNELRMQEQFWRIETGRPLLKTAAPATDLTSKPPKYSSFAGPSPASAPPSSARVPASTATKKPSASVSPPSSRRPPGKSISEDFDGSRLDYGIEPESKKRMMRYRIPGTDRTMWCQRSCRRCGGDHFDFAHDYCANHTIASVNTAAVEDDLGYLVTIEEEDTSSGF
ncbi:hypothetical protein CF327_g6661 [Tilletia walkeri]|nr:hypothetical protein CF327_g6661 [Tilletia walkeri]